MFFIIWQKRSSFLDIQHPLTNTQKRKWHYLDGKMQVVSIRINDTVAPSQLPDNISTVILLVLISPLLCFKNGTAEPQAASCAS